MKHYVLIAVILVALYCAWLQSQGKLTPMLLAIFHNQQPVQTPVPTTPIQAASSALQGSVYTGGSSAPVGGIFTSNTEPSSDGYGNVND